MIIADLHVHSRFSRATSGELDLEHLWIWAQKKGVDLVGTGDFTHPGWHAQLREKLVPDAGGFLALKPELETALLPQVPPACRRSVRFVLQTEISSIYKFGDRVRKVHTVLLFPHLDAVEEFNRGLGRVGNLASDGRPILGLDARNLLEMALDVTADAVCIPAHIWTPWFSVLGSRSGFDSLDECYRDLIGHVHAVETGLSSDPPMNWRVSGLDRFFLVSSSDAHSPDRLAREATLFEHVRTYPDLVAALSGASAQDGPAVAGTIEFFPEEGKYHLDGHRKCNARLDPCETRRLNGLCPVCGKPVTVGVLSRVEDLADRASDSAGGPLARPYHSLVGLHQAIAESLGLAGRGGKQVERTYDRLLHALGSELGILMEVPLEELARASTSLAAAVERIRAGDIRLDAGFDGEFGTVRIFPAGEVGPAA